MPANSGAKKASCTFGDLSLHEIFKHMSFFRTHLLMGVLLLASQIGLQGQIDNLPIIPSVNIPMSPMGMGEMIEEEEIPSREELRLLGLSEDEIDLIYENLENYEEPSATEQFQMGQESLRQPTPIQGDGGTISSTGGAEASDEELDVATDDEFSEDMLEEAEREELIFGHRFLRNLVEFDRATGDRAPDNYVLKDGDEITITAYGNVDFQGIYTLSEDGYIFQKEAGRVYLKGMELGDAKVLLRNRWGRFIDLRGSQFDVAITYSPVIRVNIVGEVENPGTYTISSWNAAFNALAVAAGPTDLGSVRKIEVRRGGQTIKIMDVYKFLMDPASNQDFFLEDNDYLVVPSHGKTVSVEGQVKRPHTYELLEHEGLTDLITYSGGLMPAAYSRSVQIQRFERSQRRLLNVDLDSIYTYGGEFALLDGDVIRIDTVPETFENFVEVRGGVNFPGQYELRSGFRIFDVLEQAQGNGKYESIDQAYLIRLDEDFNPRYIPIDIDQILEDPASEDNVLLEERDIIEVISKTASVEDWTVSIDGAVKSPGEFTYAKGMTLRDLLFYAGGTKTEAAVDRIEVARVVDYNASDDNFQAIGGTQIETVSIGFDLQNDAAAAEYMLQPYDEIYVHIAEGFDFQQKVKITGEVRFPGTYTLSDDLESVTDLLNRAGGLTAAAFEEGAAMFRNGGSGYEIPTRLVLELESALDDPESPFNHVLVGGDSIYIPKMMDFVELTGVMLSPEIDTGSIVSVPYETGKRAKYYINNYGGGFEKRAKRKNTIVVEPNGKVRRTKEIFWANIYPKVKTEGSRVVVMETDRPETEYSSEFEKKPFDWNIFVATTSASIMSFATIYALISRSNQ